MKYVHDEVDVIQEHPASLLEPLDMRGRRAFLLHVLEHVLADRTDGRIRSAAGNEEEVGHVRHPSEIEEDDVLRFVIQRDLGGSLRERERVGRCGGDRWHEVRV